MDNPGYETFEDRIGEAFTVQTASDPGEPLEVVLVELHEHARSESGTRLSFSAVFEGPISRPLAQGTYEFSGGEESFALFIVPIGTTEDRLRYEAVFTRLATPS